MQQSCWVVVTERIFGRGCIKNGVAITHMIAHQFIDGLNSYHKSSAEQGDWFGVQGRVEAVFIPFILSNRIQLVRRTGGKAHRDSTDEGLISKYYLPQRG